MLTSPYPPVFVVGSARSGTTLLYSILLSSGEYPVYQAETLLLSVCKPKYGDLKINKNYQRFMNDWLQSKQFYRSNLDPTEFAQGAINHCDSYLDFMQYFMECIAGKQGKAKWVEKTPAHIFYMDLLSRFFPDAKFIHIVRDGRDVAISKRKLGWSGTRNTNELIQLIYAAKSWEMSVKAGRRQGEKLGANYLEIHYEDVINDTEESLWKIGKFTGTAINISQIKGSAVGSLGKANTAHGDKFQGLSSESIGKWKTRMNQNEKDLFHYVSGDTLAEFGYKPESPQSVIPWKLRVHSTICPAILGMKLFLKSKTAMGRFISDTLEMGLR